MTEAEPVPEVEAPKGEVKWGRVLVAGGTRWLALGKKDKIEVGDLPTPHLLRALLNFRITSLITSHSSFHAIALDTHGAPHFIGRNSSSSFGISASILPESDPMFDYKIVPRDLPGAGPDERIVTGGTGRSHTILVGSSGRAWGAGRNVEGQCGVSTSHTELTKFTQIRGPWERDPSCKIIAASCGITFTLLLTSTGIVYACGSSEHGQLGNGKTGERIVTGGKLAWDLQEVPKAIPQFSPRKIVGIACGQQHSIAVDEEGYVWAWGFAGYGRLGLGNQVDKLVPTMVPQFSGNNPLSRALTVHCGPTCSIVVDRQKMYQIAGKWKTTGDGSSGAPYTTFKYIQDIMHLKMISVSSGGNGHFAVAPADGDEVMVVGFGQGCLNAELGLGPGEPKNATKPTRVVPLNHLKVFQVAAAGFTSFFLAEPTTGVPWEELPRWPEVVDSEDVCLICDETKEDMMPMECEKCESPYHPTCLTPPLEEAPEGEWFCPNCVKEAESIEITQAPPAAEVPVLNGKGKGKAAVGAGKRKAEPEGKKLAVSKKKK